MDRKYVALGIALVLSVMMKTSAIHEAFYKSKASSNKPAVADKQEELDDIQVLLADRMNVQKLLSSMDSKKIIEFYSKLFDRKFEEISELTTDEDSIIAVQAAWKLFTEFGLLKRASELDVLKYSAQYFLGVFEGRNRLLVPDWWAKCIIDLKGPEFYVLPHNLPDYHKSGFLNVKCPIDSSLTEENGIVTYRRGNDSIELPREIFEEANVPIQNVVCTFTDQNCFATVHCDFGYPHKLFNIERASKKLLWSSNVCGCLFYASSGVSKSHVSIIPLKDGRVCVFGATWATYAQVFRVSDGKTLFQFSSGFTDYKGNEEKRILKNEN